MYECRKQRKHERNEEDGIGSQIFDKGRFISCQIWLDWKDFYGGAIEETWRSEIKRREGESILWLVGLSPFPFCTLLLL